MFLRMVGEYGPRVQRKFGYTHVEDSKKDSVNVKHWTHCLLAYKLRNAVNLLEYDLDLKHSFLVFSPTGRRPASLCRGPLSVVRPSIRALTFSLNIFFSETTYRILMKFHRNVSAMVLFRIS